jgi:hypothetical protein
MSAAQKYCEFLHHSQLERMFFHALTGLTCVFMRRPLQRFRAARLTIFIAVDSGPEGYRIEGGAERYLLYWGE